jgi:hypothetical protein
METVAAGREKMEKKKKQKEKARGDRSRTLILLNPMGRG